MTFHGEKYTLEKPVLSTLGEKAVILSLLGVDVMDQPVKITLILEMAGEPFWSHCSALAGMEIGIPTVAWIRSWSRCPAQAQTARVLQKAQPGLQNMPVPEVLDIQEEKLSWLREPQQPPFRSAQRAGVS